MIGLEQETVVIADQDEEWGHVAAAAVAQLSQITAVDYIDKGWSRDKKYKITAASGAKYLLRVTPEEKAGSGSDGSQGIQNAKQVNMFHIQQKVAALGVPMSRPVACGRCKEGFYSIQTWVEGRDAEETIPGLSDARQYAYGLEAGRILKIIHSIPAPETQPEWETRFNAKMDRKIKMYRECPVKFDGAEDIIAYIEGNRHLLKGRPQSFQHGDYHVGNMMIENDKIVIIDFDRYDYGDPWEEFNRITWCAQCSPLFASGMVNAYFDGEVPMEFWRLLALYISSNMLSSIPWAIPYGEQEIQTMLKQAGDVLDWYDHMRNPVPTWYSKEYYLQYIDGLPYKMKAPFDFGFIHTYGKVFKIFDDQDSGNICFGVCDSRENAVLQTQVGREVTLQLQSVGDGDVCYPAESAGNGAPRYFIKFAGAPTKEYDGTPEDAVERLKSTLPVYMDLKHPCLIELLDAQDIAGGFAMVFRWAEGDCMGRMYPMEHHRFMNLPVEDRLQVFRDVLSFLEYVHERGYVAIDFYDGSVMYDACSRKGAIEPLNRDGLVNSFDDRNAATVSESSETAGPDAGQGGDADSERNEATGSCDRQDAAKLSESSGGTVSSDARQDTTAHIRKGKTTICDIDFFGRKPYYNHMGRMWGSSSFMSPEEFTLGAELDEVTNVYTAGAFAFALFGGYRRSLDNWTLGEACFEVAKKAVSDDRGSRQQSLRQLIREWEQGVQIRRQTERDME